VIHLFDPSTRNKILSIEVAVARHKVCFITMLFIHY